MWNKRFSGFIGLFVLLSTVTLFLACKKDQTPEKKTEPFVTFEMDMQPRFGQVNLSLDSIYTTDEGYQLKWTAIKCYFSQLSTSNLVFHQAALFDYAFTGTQFAQFSGRSSDYPNLSCILGVDSLNNHADPAAFPNTSALNILQANDMHWGWNPGYIFLKLEAKIDTIPDQTLNMDHQFVFHIGGDQYKKNLVFDSIPWQLKDAIYSSTLYFDLKKVLAGPELIDLKTEYSSHSSPGQEILSEKIIKNAQFAFSFKP